MLTELYNFQECPEHGEYTEEQQRRMGVVTGCPICGDIEREFAYDDLEHEEIYCAEEVECEDEY